MDDTRQKYSIMSASRSIIGDLLKTTVDPKTQAKRPEIPKNKDSADMQSICAALGQIIDTLVDIDRRTKSVEALVRSIDSRVEATAISTHRTQENVTAMTNQTDEIMRLLLVANERTAQGRQVAVVATNMSRYTPM